MLNWLQKTFTPWKCAAFFDSEADFEAFLVRRNRLLNGVRVALFAVAAVLLFIGYNASDGGNWSIAAISDHPYYIIAVGVLVVALAVSLIIIENEKQLPKELHMK